MGDYLNFVGKNKKVHDFSFKFGVTLVSIIFAMMENSEENVSGLITYDILKVLLWKKNSKTLI